MRPGNILIILIVCIAAAACRQNNVPKPRGHFRIDLPEKQYTVFSGQSDDIPVSFEYPHYGNIISGEGNENEKGWLNIDFPQFGARLYLTYKDVNNDFAELMEQTYTLNIKNHITRADAIDEVPFINEKNNVYGMLYDLKGNTATALQFYATDSLNHYLRGSLYFSAEPDADSLAPVIDFFRSDIMHIIGSLKWKM